MSEEIEKKPVERIEPTPLKQVCNRECENRSSRYTQMTRDYCNQFWFERYSCIALSLIGVLLLVVVVVIAIRNSQPDFKNIATLTAGIFGGGGFITKGISSLFKFMDRADVTISRFL